jgi:hypothetical protein
MFKFKVNKTQLEFLSTFPIQYIYGKEFRSEIDIKKNLIESFLNLKIKARFYVIVGIIGSQTL